MSDTKTWFLPPDTTFTTDGPLQLGMVLEHPKRPTKVLASLATNPTIALPTANVLTEKDHTHIKQLTSSRKFGVWADFFSAASAAAHASSARHNVLTYGTTDHEIRTFGQALTADVAAAILEVPAVRRHVDAGRFGRRPVYVVSGLRIAKRPYAVTKEDSSASEAAAAVSGAAVVAAAAGSVPVRVGVDAADQRARAVAGAYVAAADTVFAYRLHVIRQKRRGVEAEMFSSDGAFMMGTAGDEVEEAPAVVEATSEEVDADLEEEAEYFEVAVAGDEKFVWVE